MSLRRLPLVRRARLVDAGFVLYVVVVTSGIGWLIGHVLKGVGG